MLTVEEKQNNKITFVKLLTKLGIDLTDLTEYLESIKYFDSPYIPNKVHGYSGGLCQHALATYLEFMQLANAYKPGAYSEQTIIKVALFKDIYRAVMYEEFNRNVKDESGQWQSVVDYRTKTERPAYGELGFSSFMSLRKFIEFTDEEVEAIVNWNCFSDNVNKTKDAGEVFKQYPLCTLTAMADLAATYLA